MKLRSPATLALVLVACTYVLLVFGSTVRAHHAGLACPDWPMCFGEVIPPLDMKVGLEWGHRVLAGAISLGFLGLAGWLLVVRRFRGAVAALWGSAALVLAVQIVLGGLTVLHLLAEWTVVSHLLTGYTFAALLLVLAMGLVGTDRGVTRQPVHWAQRLVAAGVGVAVVLQVGLGGWVSSADAGTVCGPVWPACAGESWFPTFAGVVGIQVMHRTMAYLLVAVVLIGLAATRLRGRLGVAAGIVAALTLVQATIGVANVLWSLPVELTLLHSAGAAALFLAAAAWNAEAWRAPLSVRASGGARHAPAPQPSLEAAR